MLELKRCPFCGGKAKLVYREPMSAVKCQKCKALGAIVADCSEQGDSKNGAAEAWNRRTENG